MSYQFIEEKLARGETIIMDGGTGTDIHRRGAPMSGDVCEPDPPAYRARGEGCGG